MSAAPKRAIVGGHRAGEADCRQEEPPAFGRARSLDDLVRAHQDGLRDREPESVGSLQVNDQFDLRGLLDGQVGRLSTLENLVHEVCGLSEAVGEAWPVRAIRPPRSTSSLDA